MAISANDVAFVIGRSTFRGNTSTRSVGVVALSDAPVTVTDSTFTDNVGGALQYLGSGPAIVSSPAGSLVVTGSTFRGDTASGFGGAAIQSRGGSPTTIVGSVLEGNVQSGFVGEGGAISAQGDTTIASSRFVGNLVSSTATESSGGAAFLGDGQVLVTDTRFRDNTARGAWSEPSAGRSTRSSRCRSPTARSPGTRPWAATACPSSPAARRTAGRCP